ncbi:protein kinase [Stieleria sp. TO1_6]|uniref:WD40 repeat domain-containing serine/threonine protein kinase n=1 Tax=Stieleria tagensis TaxID=2956795 RepID=UPI00209A7E0A|nr:protein kinase [Stieleria tagensis]MCO8121579.1 protein kinase [Stieleria tagensis]
MMVVICSYCGAECNESDQANGRCGSCASFFNGNEEVVEHHPTEQPAASLATIAPTAALPTAAPEPIPPTADSDGGNAPGPFDPSAVQPDDSGIEVSDSEGLIQPRRLSPQFRRRVEMTWQSTLNRSVTNAEHTLSSQTPNEGTKRENPTLSIATRRITNPKQNINVNGEGDYELNDVIGEGSMGQVWSARQTSLDRNVAVKVPKAELAGAGSLGESQFISEVVVTGKLEHPNIVPIYELGRDSSGLPFYSMKHVQGRPWNEFITEKSDQENLEILMKVCDAIAFAHDRNFLHRDIKPHNVMVGEFGEVSVMDWGIAVSVARDPDQPWAAVATGPAGTPAYMAPEMAAHNPSELGVVSDVYLLGAVLYEIVTGTPPHPRTGDTGEALLSAAANEITPTTRSGELVDIARRAMATNLIDRYQSVKELQDALREYQSHRESIQLSESADQHLGHAKQQGSSDEFARARFAYEEALRLWKGNASAATGLRLATVAHAQNALDQENFELGISILDPTNPDHRDLLTKLETKRSSRRRLAWFSKIAAGTALVAVLSVVVITVSKNKELDKKNGELDRRRVEAVREKLNADNAAALAVSEADKARRAEQTARTARDTAVLAKVEARRAEGTARQQKRNAEEAAYSSEIGLAAESIRRNQFNKAAPILAGLEPSLDPDSDSVMSKLRHIEWGLLAHASSPGPVQDLLPAQRIETVASSQDGATFAAGTEDGRVVVWQKVNPTQPLPEPSTLQFGSKLSAIAVSNDGRYIAAAGTDRQALIGQSQSGKFPISLWDLQSGSFPEPLLSLSGHTAEVLSLSFSTDTQKLVSSAADRTAVVWDRSTGERLTTMRDHSDRQVWCARFSPDGRDIVTACDDGRVRVWQTRDGDPQATKIHDFRGHEGPVYAAVFTPNGRTVISGGYDRRLLRWNLRGNQDSLAASDQSDFEARLEGRPVEKMPMQQIGSEHQQHEASIRSISVGTVDSRDFILTAGNDNTVRVWNPLGDGWTLDKVLRGHGRWVRSCTFTQSGQAVLSAAYDGVKLWDWQNYSMPRELFPIAERRFGSQPGELGLSDASKALYSPDGRWVATAYTNGTVAVWDLQSGQRAASQLLVDGHALLTATGKFFDGGKQLLTSAGDNTTRLWDVSRGTQSSKLSGTGYRGAASVSWRPNDSTALVVSGSDDRMHPAWFWQIKSGHPVAKRPLLVDYARDRISQQMGLSNSPADSATADSISLVSLNDADFSRLRQLKRGIPDVTAVSFSDQGDFFVVGNSRGECFVYQVDAVTAQPVQLVQFLAHGSAVSAAAFLPSGQSLITASVDGQVRQWDTQTGAPQQQFPWSGPVTALDLSQDGALLVVGHAPVESENLPVAQVFRIDGDQPIIESQLINQDPSDNRDWAGNQPSVQSAQFTSEDNRVMLSLFFPDRNSNANLQETNPKRWSGYRLGFWDWQQQQANFTALPSATKGEIAAAVLGEDPSGQQLLVVGGKGARLWAADDYKQQRFTRLTASFRPALSITTVDFSINPKTGLTNRLVVGDREGNVRIWELDGDVWSESVGAAAQLSGEHQSAIVSTTFDPTNADRIVSADANGVWKLWQYTDTWNIQQQFQSDQANQQFNSVLFSPDGKQILACASDGAMIWRRNDQDSFELDPQPPKTGAVQFATYAADGSWLVTSDGDRTVLFWDSLGHLIATMATEDAKGMTSMTLSHDRRRFVSGYRDKRIVIWDTSRVIEAQQDAGPENEKWIKELLTLEEHRGVSSVSISPNGRNLLSSGVEGRTIIWTGQAIAPISISFSRDQFNYQANSGPVNLDASAVLSDPSRLASFANAELVVSLGDQLMPGERLLLRSTEDSAGAKIEMASAGDQTALIYHAHQNAVPLIVGMLAPTAVDSNRLQVSLSDAADTAAVQTLLRTLAYQIGAQDTSLRTVGLNTSRQLEEMSGATRQVKIEITGISYNDQPVKEASLGDDQQQVLYPTAITTEFAIEVETGRIDEELAGADDTSTDDMASRS